MKKSHWPIASKRSLRSRDLRERRPLLLAYLDAWRNAADDVEAASRRWRAASGHTRSDAALAFFAALDREEQAAAAYQLAWEAR
jgi:hypothetical protein